MHGLTDDGSQALVSRDSLSMVALSSLEVLRHVDDVLTGWAESVEFRDAALSDHCKKKNVRR